MATERSARARELRIAGTGWAEVAARLGYASPKSARQSAFWSATNEEQAAMQAVPRPRTSARRAPRHGACVDRGMSGAYRTWIAMKTRCYNPGNHSYGYYGGRGIEVCDRWRNSFENFLADMGERPQGRTLDRIDPDGHYTPENCRWATAKEQTANRRQAVA